MAREDFLLLPHRHLKITSQTGMKELIKTKKKKKERHGKMIAFCPICDWIIVKDYPTPRAACCDVPVALHETATSIRFNFKLGFGLHDKKTR